MGAGHLPVLILVRPSKEWFIGNCLRHDSHCPFRFKGSAPGASLSFSLWTLSRAVYLALLVLQSSLVGLIESRILTVQCVLHFRSLWL